MTVNALNTRPDASDAEYSSEICFLSAVEMAELIRRKRLSAVEVVEAHLRQIERANPKANAIVTLVAEQALTDARRADEQLARGEPAGPLHGLPVVHKDLHETKGIRTTFGSRIFEDHVPQTDAIMVERFRKAGAITIGKSNTPEFGAGSQTFNEVFGPTHNPYDLTKTCGGSSGGAAVALACGMVPIAGGSDMGGSLRNPAAFSNVVGLRPAPGRVPKWAKGLAWSTLGVDGPMARTVADVALILSAIAGPDPRCPIAIAEPGGLFSESLDRDFRGVRVALCSALRGVTFEAVISETVEAQRKVFESLGCVVEDAQPDFSEADEVFKTLRAWHFHAQYAAVVKAHPALVKDTILWEIERAERLTAADIARAETLRSQLYERFRLFLSEYEFLVLPVTQVAPFDISEPWVREINGVKMDTYIDWMKSCYYISTVGNPAISVPCGFTSGGLPVGLQIVARHQAERSLLEIAHAFEQATQVGRKRPPVLA